MLYFVVFMPVLASFFLHSASFINMYTCTCRGFESHVRQMGEYEVLKRWLQLIFLRKSYCLGCAVLLCLVCLLLSSFLLISH